MVIVAGLLIVNAALSYKEEQQAERAVEALKGKLSINAKVLRDGQWTTTLARQLVPGDVIRLRAGDFAPADIKLADGELHIDQSRWYIIISGLCLVSILPVEFFLHSCCRICIYCVFISFSAQYTPGAIVLQT